MTEHTSQCKDCKTKSCESLYNEDSECWQPNAALQVLANGINNAKEYLQAVTNYQLVNQSHNDPSQPKR